MKKFLKYFNNLKKMPDMVKVLKNKETMVKKKRQKYVENMGKVTYLDL